MKGERALYFYSFCVTKKMGTAILFKALLIGLTILGFTQIFMHSFLLYDREALDTACNNDNVCQRGVAKTVGGVKFCSVRSLAPGASCTSACYADGTTTHCTSEQECISTDSTACLGACVITDPGGSIFENDHPDCEDKLVFKDFYTWNTSLSSENPFGWMHYTDFPGTCDALMGCMWYGMRLRLYYREDLVDWYDYTGSDLDCFGYLNMTNDACIGTIEVPVDNEIATPLFRGILDPFTAENLTLFTFQSSMCLFNYKCAVANTSALVDPAYLYGGAKKRGLLQPLSVDHERHVTHFVRLAQLHSKTMGEKLWPHVESRMQAHEERKRAMEIG